MRGMIDGVLDTDRSYPVPKTIKNHPGVLEALDGPSQGFDYKWNVFLREGWRFENGRMEGTRTGNFNSVSDFRTANPVRIKANG